MPVPTLTRLTRRAGLVAVIAALLLVLPVPAEPIAQAAGIAVPVRVRMDLDTRNLYLYENSATATTRLKDSAVSGLNANTWLDLSHAANNKAGTDGTYCLAVNNNGYTVYVNQDGPVVSCANQTATSRALVGEARTLTAPTSPAISFSTVAPTIGASFTASESGANIARREWMVPEGSAQTTPTTSGITYNSTGLRTFTMRAVGTKGERLVTGSVTATNLTVTFTAVGSPGGAGGNGAGFYANQPTSAGSAGGAGSRVLGTYTVTSLPASFILANLGLGAGGAGSDGTQASAQSRPAAPPAPTGLGGAGGSGQANGGTGGDGIYGPFQACTQRNPCLAIVTYGGGGGGGSGYSPTVSLGDGTLLLRAAGGTGGAGGIGESTAGGAGGAGGQAPGNFLHGSLTGTSTAPAAAASTSVRIQAPALGIDTTYTANQTVTLS